MRYIYTPITLINSQSQASPSNFQQLIQTTTIQYPNGVRFWSPTDGWLPAWLESIQSNSANIWVKIPSSIPANGTYQLYMIQDSTLSMDGSYWGEAPQLSPTYAEYDNGSSVFNFYDNFAGVKLNSIWATYGYITVNVENGVTLNSTNVFDNSLYTNTNALPNNVYDVYWKEMPSSTSLQYQAMINMNVSAGYGLVAWDSGLEYNSVVWAEYTNWSSVAGVGTITYPLPAQTSMHISSFAYVPPHMYWSVNDNPLIQLPGSTSVPPASFGLKLGTTGTAVYVQWVRARSFPPNGVMPSVYIGTPQYSGTFAIVP